MSWFVLVITVCTSGFCGDIHTQKKWGDLLSCKWEKDQIAKSASVLFPKAEIYEMRCEERTR